MGCPIHITHRASNTLISQDKTKKIGNLAHTGREQFQSVMMRPAANALIV